ncbi:MAG TPA: hypothetical protein VIJ34_09305, partial [Acidimicrobiales bacterium]
LHRCADHVYYSCAYSFSPFLLSRRAMSRENVIRDRQKCLLTPEVRSAEKEGITGYQNSDGSSN